MKKNMFTLINSLIAIVLFALFAGCVPEPKPKADQIIQRLVNLGPCMLSR